MALTIRQGRPGSASTRCLPCSAPACLLVLQAIVSLAIILWFKKNGGGNVFTTVIAPAMSFVVQIWLVYTLIANLATLGGTNGFAQSIPYVGLAIIVIGLIWGFVLKSTNPDGLQEHRPHGERRRLMPDVA